MAKKKYLKVLPSFLNLIIVLSIFLIGFFSYPLLGFYFESELEKPFSIPFLIYENQIPSPSDFINKENISIYPDRIIIYIEDASISSYADTGSMVPFLNHNSNGIRIIPNSENEISIGDIISFRRSGKLIVHRVIERGFDEKGVYFITKGDNNNLSDGKIRFYEIEYLTVGILY